MHATSLFFLAIFFMLGNSLASGQQQRQQQVGQANTVQKVETQERKAPLSQFKPVVADDATTVPLGFEGIVYGMLENVVVQPSGFMGWAKALDNMAIKIGAEIRTSRGKTKVRLRNRGQLRLPPLSHVLLKKGAGLAATIVLQKGKVWSNTTKPTKEGFNMVRTPDLVAAVRGGLFNMQAAEQGGSRLAVFEGEVLVNSVRQTQVEPVRVLAGQAIEVSADGTISVVTPVGADEYKEWDEWDQWALEVHEQIGSRFVFGGQQIDNLAKLVAIDGQRADAINKEAEGYIVSNREGKHVDDLRDAFYAFYKDTGYQPTEKDGYGPLIENSKKWKGWKGPYLKGPDATIPPKDRWGEAIRYVQLETPSGKKIMGVVSCGPNKLFSKGKSDDLLSYVNYAMIKR